MEDKNRPFYLLTFSWSIFLFLVLLIARSVGGASQKMLLSELIFFGLMIIFHFPAFFYSEHIGLHIRKSSRVAVVYGVSAAMVMLYLYTENPRSVTGNVSGVGQWGYDLVMYFLFITPLIAIFVVGASIEYLMEKKRRGGK